MLQKTDRSSFETLKRTIYSIHPDIPEEVFQPGFDRDAAESYLKKNPHLPFIVRSSRFGGYYTIDYVNSSDNNRIYHHLIKPPASNESEYTIWTKDDIGFSQTTINFQLLFARRWESSQSSTKPSGAQMRERWEQFKKKNESAPDLRAVFSLQTLDDKKVALTAEQVTSYGKLNQNSIKDPGDGHTGLALATALQTAPFVVLRSEGNREQATEVLSKHVGNDGLIVVTGHSSPDSNTISGNYGPNEEDPYKNQIKRGPAEIVSFAKEAGLKKGSHITIVLTICYGAKSIESPNSSFAHKLAKEFAEAGISTTIIASDKPVHRFGAGVIKDQQIEFSNNVGMEPDSVNVLFTDVDPTTLKRSTVVFKPHEAIKVTSNGLRFSNLLEKSVHASPSEAATVPSQSKQPSVSVDPKTTSTTVGTKAARVAPAASSAGEELLGQGLRYETGIAVEVNYRKAMELYKQAASLGLNKGLEMRLLLQRIVRKIKRDNDLFKSIEELGVHGGALKVLGLKGGHSAEKISILLRDRLINFLLTCENNEITQLDYDKFNVEFSSLLKLYDQQVPNHKQLAKPDMSNILLKYAQMEERLFSKKVIFAAPPETSPKRNPTGLGSGTFFDRKKSGVLKENDSNPTDSAEPSSNPLK